MCGSVLLPFVGVLGYISCFLQRVPTYFIGLYLGKKVIEGKENIKIERLLFGLLLLCGIVGLIFIKGNTLNYTWKYVIYLLLTYPGVVGLAFLLDKVNERISCVKILSFLGVMTLEIYLFQEKIHKVINILFQKVHLQIDGYNVCVNVIVIVMTLIAAYIYHRITNWVYVKVTSKESHR